MEVTSESFELHNGRRNNCFRQALYKDSSSEGKSFRHFFIQIGILKILTLQSEDSWLVFPNLLWFCVHLFRIFHVTQIINARDIQPYWFPCVHQRVFWAYKSKSPNRRSLLSSSSIDIDNTSLSLSHPLSFFFFFKCINSLSHVRHLGKIKHINK